MGEGVGPVAGTVIRDEPFDAVYAVGCEPRAISVHEQDRKASMVERADGQGEVPGQSHCPSVACGRSPAW